MSYRDNDNDTSGSHFPCVAILLAMAALAGALVSVRQPVVPARVWVPVQSAGSSTVKPAAACSPARAGCNPTDEASSESIAKTARIDGHNPSSGMFKTSPHALQ
ncbi:hypothetical protein EV131_101610 [Rhizobium laguerreae]|uniref:Secreted protein n=1 Tax=Rhizobium laguerreae TaxID=1076926 RepID=A0AAX2QUR8_9HYPH|nr:hypothetical protein EV131_101610 [Rhizobium laguerreae]